MPQQLQVFQSLWKRFVFWKECHLQSDKIFIIDLRIQPQHLNNEVKTIRIKNNTSIVRVCVFLFWIMWLFFHFIALLLTWWDFFFPSIITSPQKGPCVQHQIPGNVLMSPESSFSYCPDTPPPPALFIMSAQQFSYFHITVLFFCPCCCILNVIIG